MIIGSFNIRGLGSLIKKEEVGSFFTKYKLAICCIQETKLGSFTEGDGKLMSMPLVT